jgi:hypothetical protein
MTVNSCTEPQPSKERRDYAAEIIAREAARIVERESVRERD